MIIIWLYYLVLFGEQDSKYTPNQTPVRPFSVTFHCRWQSLVETKLQLNCFIMRREQGAKNARNFCKSTDYARYSRKPIKNMSPAGRFQGKDSTRLEWPRTRLSPVSLNTFILNHGGGYIQHLLTSLACVTAVAKILLVYTATERLRFIDNIDICIIFCRIIYAFKMSLKILSYLCKKLRYKLLANSVYEL